MKIARTQKGAGNSRNLKLVAHGICSLLLMLCVSVQAQQTTKVPRVGFLGGSTPDAEKDRLVGFRQGLGDLGYIDDSGTSMAAPHVSGAIAAFLSIRREFIQKPMKVKEIFTSTATCLGRERYFQGNGLVDLMRAIQSV